MTRGLGLVKYFVWFFVFFWNLFFGDFEIGFKNECGTGTGILGDLVETDIFQGGGPTLLPFQQAYHPHRTTPHTPFIPPALIPFL